MNQLYTLKKKQYIMEIKSIESGLKFPGFEA